MPQGCTIRKDESIRLHICSYIAIDKKDDFSANVCMGSRIFLMEGNSNMCQTSPITQRGLFPYDSRVKNHGSYESRVNNNKYVMF